MNVNYMYSLIAVVVLFLLAYVGVEGLGLQVLFGIIIPYVAVVIFIAGFVFKVADWARRPVPYAIPTTGGQQKSFPWIKQATVDNPSSSKGVFVRMALEILLFRSLFRNTKFEMKDGDRFSFEWEKWLWIASLAFHYSFFTVVFRHLRFFTEPVPWFIQQVEKIDGFLQLGLPGLFISGVVLLLAVIYLFLRRVWIPQLRYISLPSDFFPLFLIAGIALSGLLMRYFIKTDIVGAKQLALGLVTLQPTIPDTVGAIFYVHVFLVSVLLAYFPFSKLMHLGGVFLSPTRNIQGNTREYRHVNPWNPEVEFHTYEEYEDEFRAKMIAAGLPVDKKE